MTVLITNDDGIDAPGLSALAAAVQDAVTVIAPRVNQSRCSHQFTYASGLMVEQQGPSRYAVLGTPADCVRLGLGVLAKDTQLILSGINAGSNMGLDVYLSGTVAAAREGAFHRRVAIAISQQCEEPQDVPIDWLRSTELAQRVLQEILHWDLPEDQFWNVNLPSKPLPSPKLVLCPICPTPLPLTYVWSGGRYFHQPQPRTQMPETDVEVCLSGNIAVSRLRLAG